MGDGGFRPSDSLRGSSQDHTSHVHANKIPSRLNVALSETNEESSRIKFSPHRLDEEQGLCDAKHEASRALNNKTPQ